MPSYPPPSADSYDFRAILAALGGRARVLLAGAATVGVVSFAVLSLLTPKYASQAQIEIVSKGLGNPFEPRRDSSSPEMISVRMDKEAIGTHVRALQSSDLALKLAKQFDLAARPEFNSRITDRDGLVGFLRSLGWFAARAKQSDDERVLRAFADALRVYQIKDTRGIIIEFKAEEPELAAAIANRSAELYRDDLALRAVQETEDARAKLGPQIGKLAIEVAAAEAEVTRFRGQANIFEAGREKSGLNEQQLSELTAELTKAATAKAEALARAAEAREVAARGAGETLADVQKSALVPRLVEQRVRLERQLAELSATLLPAHPRMKQLNADLAGLKEQIKTEVRNVVEGLEREVKVASLREEGVRQRIEEAKSRVVSAGADDVRLRALESLAKSKRAEFERLQAQLEAARTTADARAVPVEVQIISRARPSSEPVSPRPLLLAALTAFAAGLLGLAFLLTRELLRDWPRPGSGAVMRAGPSARRQPMRRGLASAAGATAWRSAPPAFPTISSIARHLISEARGRSGFRTVVAGEAAAASIVAAAMDLTRRLADQGRHAILLDWRVHADTDAGSFGQAPALGFTDVLLGRVTFEEAVGRIPNSSAHYIVARACAEGAAVAKDKDRVNMLFDALAEAYDHIVIAGANEAVGELIATIEGNIDAGLVAGGEEGVQHDGSFLGFDAAQLHLICYAPTRTRQRAVAVLAAAAP
jgi:succinoglycan biosynthesis transport protein ExoP